MFVNVASESGGSKLLSSRPYHSVEMNTDGNKHCDKKNYTTRRAMFAIEIKIQYLFI